ncbi:group III truncated hemoglobin [Novosphingobium mangrovi (ex Huang et al. 2023)]|uniref:Group III truncated hemoglobin n=1 Tax=Novosphingobium mangrovi (ex Huang et al. 2023) TaxID=2976432 RepID=A0ABT2I668_9SPHN|nr:group III truncated hemoglobin [Novosphingobium mangrovi (ex Huang et al. 2023)]MCT2400309.1 group III truncated hemoglobin [Novosphingobium mangrovi (ex Huang et al. 2023)]
MSGARALGQDPEVAIMAMVRRFYTLSLDDDLLGPMFRAEIDDFDEHYGIVADFWSHALLGTDRYKRGTPYVHHTGLKVEEAHFDRWMVAFAQAVDEELPDELAGPAMQRALHMTESFKMGLLPLKAPDAAARARPTGASA